MIIAQPQALFASNVVQPSSPNSLTSEDPVGGWRSIAGSDS